MAASSPVPPGSPALVRKDSVNSVVRGAEQKLGNQPSPPQLEAAVLGMRTLLAQLKKWRQSAGFSKAHPLYSSLLGFIDVWTLAKQLGEDAKPFPTVFTAMVLMHKTLQSLGLSFSSLETEFEQASWTHAAFLLASKVEETPIGFAPRNMWSVFTHGTSASERARFHRRVRLNELNILMALGFNVVVKLPQIRILRMDAALGINDPVVVNRAILYSCIAMADPTLAIADPAALAAAALGLSGFNPPDEWVTQFHLVPEDLAIIRNRIAGLVSWLGFEEPPGDKGVAGDKAIAPYQQPKPCSLISDFELLVELNKGTYGTVWRARDKRSGEVVALKLLHGPSSKNDGFRYYVLREMLYLMRLNHPNIIDGREVAVDTAPILTPGDDFKEPDSFLFYICMELVPFDLLKLMLKQSELGIRFNQAQVKHLMRDLLKGVAHMHRFSLLHRDIKLANILLTAAGQLKLADLGSIRDVDRTALGLTIQVVSLFYRPPELLLLTSHYTSALDMWSVGCVFFELLTYRRIFSGRDESEMVQKIIRVKGAPLPKVWAEIYSTLPGVRPNILKVLKDYPDPIPLEIQEDFRKNPDITPNAIDLLSHLLDWDPRERWSALQALEHPYFSELPEPEVPIPRV